MSYLTYVNKNIT